MDGCKGWSSSFDWIFFFQKTTKSCSDGQESEWLVFFRVQLLVYCFFIYINVFPDNLESNVKLFADDTSMFSVARDTINTSQKLNNNLDKVSPWANKWRMSFHPDPSKQSQEVIFSRKMNKVYYPPLLFKNSTVQQISSQKHSGIYLDEELTFKHYINENINKDNKGIGIIHKLNNILPRSALWTIYRSFIMSLLDYGDVIYDQPENELFSSKTEPVQYNVSLVITGAVKGTSKKSYTRN